MTGQGKQLPNKFYSGHPLHALIKLSPCGGEYPETFDDCGLPLIFPFEQQGQWMVYYLHTHYLPLCTQNQPIY